MQAPRLLFGLQWRTSLRPSSCARRTNTSNFLHSRHQVVHVPALFAVPGLLHHGPMHCPKSVTQRRETTQRGKVRTKRGTRWPQRWSEKEGFSLHELAT